jgi:hypothetical protein
MKRIFLVFGLTGVFQAVAQQKDIFDAEQYLDKKAKNKGLTKVLIPSPNLKFSPIPNIINRFNRKPDGDLQELTSHPVGSMPCIRPDMNDFKAMPNAADKGTAWLFLKSGYGIIPNPALPDKIVRKK